MSVIALTYGSHVSVRIGEYWFDGTGNPEGCTSLSNNSGVGVSTTSAGVYVINSATGKGLGAPVLYGDYFTLTDLESNQTLQVTSKKCVLSRPGDNSQNLLFSFGNLGVANYTQPYMAPYFTSPSQPVLSTPFVNTFSASLLSYQVPSLLGFPSISRSKGGRVEISSKWAGTPSLYVVSPQPPPGPPPCTGPNCPNPDFPNPNQPYCLDPNGCSPPPPPPPPPPASPSKDILYASAAVGAVGLGLVAWGWYSRKTTVMYVGAGLAVAGGGGAVYYLIRKKDDSK